MEPTHNPFDLDVLRQLMAQITDLNQRLHALQPPPVPDEFVEVAIKAFLRHRDAEVGPKTLGDYEEKLMLWHHWRTERQAPPTVHGVTTTELLGYLHYLAHERVPHGRGDRKGLAPGSVRAAWRVLRAFWNYLLQEKCLLPDQQNFFPDRVPYPAGESPLRPAYDRETITALLVAASQLPDPVAAVRARAIILLLYTSGMRISELTSLTDGQLRKDLRSARIWGKGRKQRRVYWSARGERALRVYMRLRAGERGGKRPVFRSLRPTAPPETPFGVSGVRNLLKDLAEVANVELVPGATVHTFRRTFAKRAKRRKVSDFDLMKLLGHERLTTTLIYTEESSEDLEDVHSSIWDDEDDDLTAGTSTAPAS